MSQLDALLKQRAELDAQIRQIQQSERQEALRTIRELAAKYDIDVVRELSPGSARKTGSVKGSSVPIKYRNSATGDTWTGRGLKPKWLQEQLAAGKDISEFAV